MGALHRAQILLEPEQHRTLAEIARQKGYSLSELVREIVKEFPEKVNFQRQATKTQRISKNRSCRLGLNLRKGRLNGYDMDTLQI